MAGTLTRKRRRAAGGTPVETSVARRLAATGPGTALEPAAFDEMLDEIIEPEERDDADAAGGAGEPPLATVPGRYDVSVVIPTRGRPEMLERCLRAVTNQTLPHDRYEVIVVDDGGLDTENLRAVESVRSQSDLTVSYLPLGGGKGLAAVRNSGWRLASAPVVAFTDDDTMPQPGWLEAGLAAFDEGVVGVTGRLVTPIPEHPTDYQRDAAHQAEADFVTANCFYRWTALDAIGGFDERFTQARREDADLWFAMLDRGWHTARCPEAVVVHPVRPGSFGESLRQQRKAEDNPLLRAKHPRLYRRVIGHAPRWYYAATAAGLGALGALVFRQPRKARALGALWAALTAAFAANRLRGTSKRPAHVADMLVTSALIPPVSLYRRLKGSIRYRTLLW